MSDMPYAAGRNDPCPCGSGRKFKRCCLAKRDGEDAASLRVRAAGDRIVPALLQFVAGRWGETLLLHAWEDFWNDEDIPEDLAETPEWEPMFLPWLLFAFVPDPDADDADPD